MLIKKRHIRFISDTIFMAITFTTLTQCYHQDFVTHVANNHLNTFEVVENQKDDAANKPEETNQGFFARIKNKLKPKRFDAQIKELTDREKREYTFKACPIKASTHPQVIDTVCVDKMELVRGSEEPTDHVIKRMTTLQDSAGTITELVATEMGKKRFLEQLTQPTADISELRARQEIVKELVANDQLLNHCDGILKKMKEVEHFFLAFQEQKDPAQEKLFKEVYFGDKLPSFLNKNSGSLELKTRLNNFGTFLQINQMPLQIWLDTSLLSYILSRFTPPPLSFMQACKKSAKTWYDRAKNLPQYVESFNSFPKEVKFIIGLGLGFTLTLQGILTYQALMNAKFKRDICNHLQMRMIGVADYLAGMKQLYQSATQNETLKTNLSSLKHLQELIEPSGELSDSFNRLTKLLSTRTFKGSSSFFSLTGRVLASFELMKEAKQEFAQALNALGELDTYVGIAKLYKAQKQKRVQYTFVEFVESEKPYIHAVDFWNPFIDQNVVVPNNIDLGNRATQNMILTGPNTGGKSTLIKGIMLDLLIAQAFGIAPAKQLVMTPFTKLGCHLNITDNVSGGVSLFKAEVLRAKELINTLKSLPRNQFMFVIIDEIFTGTSPDKAEQLAYDFLKQLCEFENCIFIDATHYKKLNNLEQETHGICKNYQVGVITDAHGQVQKYTYKLEPGASKINNATQIAKEESVIW